MGGKRKHGGHSGRKQQPLLCEDENVFEAETIVDKRRRKGGEWEYRVRWKGYKPSEDTWEVSENLSEALYEIGKQLKTNVDDDEEESTHDKEEVVDNNNEQECNTFDMVADGTSLSPLLLPSKQGGNIEVALEAETAKTSEDMTIASSDGIVDNKAEAWNWNAENQIKFHDIERIHVHDPTARKRVTEARLSGVPICLVGHTGWAEFAKRWLKPKASQPEKNQSGAGEAAKNYKHLLEDETTFFTEDADAEGCNYAFPALLSDAAVDSFEQHYDKTSLAFPGCGETHSDNEESSGWLDLTKDWEIDTDKMIKDIGHEKVPVVRRGYKDTNPIQDHVLLSEYLNQCWNKMDPHSCPQLYLHQWQFPLSDSSHKLCGEGCNNPLPNDIFGEDLLSYWLDSETCNASNPYQYIFMGREETLSKLHRDPGGLEITIAPIVGEKEVILGHRSDGSTCLYHLDADLENVDLEQYPMLAYARIYKSVIEPGEILLMPAGTYHQCRNLSPCLSYSRFHLDTMNLRPFLESMFDEDATEIEHQEVLWNATTDLFRQVESCTEAYKAENKEMPLHDVERKVETLRALRNICREIERRYQVQLVVRGSSPSKNVNVRRNNTGSDFSNPTDAVTHWANLIDDIDLTLHEYRHRLSASPPPFTKRRRRAKSVQRPADKGIEAAFQRHPTNNVVKTTRLPDTTSLSVGDTVQVEVRGKIFNGEVHEIETEMDAALLKYLDCSSLYDDFRPIRMLRMVIGGESSAGVVRPDDILPGKTVIFKDGREDRGYKAIVQSRKQGTFYFVKLKIGEYPIDRWIPRDAILYKKGKHT